MGEFYAKSIRRLVLNSPQSTRLTFVVQGFIFRKRYVHVRILISCQKTSVHDIFDSFARHQKFSNPSFFTCFLWFSVVVVS